MCSMINYTSDWDKTFEESHFYQKCLIMLIMFYLHNSKISKLDLQFLFAVLWKIPEKDLLIIRHDYDVIINKIREGQAHTLSEGDTMYLGACRKGQKGDSLMPQHNNDNGAPRRAWSLKTAYMRIVLNEVKNKNERGAYCNFKIDKPTLTEIFSINELRNNSVDEILEKRFAPYRGKTYREICEMLHIDISYSKQKYFIIANKIAGKGKVQNVNQTEEFEKSGLTMKTIRIRKQVPLKSPCHSKILTTKKCSNAMNGPIQGYTNYFQIGLCSFFFAKPTPLFNCQIKRLNPNINSTELYFGPCHKTTLLRHKSIGITFDKT